ncbi:MAG: hypothetical protein ACKO2G_03650 [Verrucomicrobiales bacterium]
MSTTQLLDTILRQPRDQARELATTSPPARLLIILGSTAIVSILVFGLVIGWFGGGAALWQTPLKLTGGLLFTCLICFPSLCILGALAGSDAGPRGHFAVLLGGLALTGLLLLGLAPVLWVFSQSTGSPGFFGFLALGLWWICMLAGLFFIARGLRGTTIRGFGPLALWTGIFLLVALQTVTSLRPLLEPTDKLFAEKKMFFLEHWVSVMNGESQNASDEEVDCEGETVVDSSR